MYLDVMCPGCGRVRSVPREAMGMELRCPDCDEPVTIPLRPWYYRRQGVEFGPICPRVLRWLASRGEIWPDTPLRHGDTGKWVPAGGISGLFTSVAESKEKR